MIHVFPVVLFPPLAAMAAAPSITNDLIEIPNSAGNRKPAILAPPIKVPAHTADIGDSVIIVNQREDSGMGRKMESQDPEQAPELTDKTR